MAMMKKMELMSSARPTTPVTASVCTGCTAKSSEAIWATDLRKVRVTIQFLEVGSHSFYVADIYRKSGSYQKFENK